MLKSTQAAIFTLQLLRSEDSVYNIQHYLV